MSWLEIGLILIFFALPIGGLLYFSAQQEALVRRYGVLSLIWHGSFTTILLILARVFLDLTPVEYQILRHLGPAGSLGMGLAFSPVILDWILVFQITFLVAAIQLWANDKTDKWSAKKTFYFLVAYPIGYLILLLSNPYVALICAELLMGLLFIFGKNSGGEEGAREFSLRGTLLLAIAFTLAIAFLIDNTLTAAIPPVAIGAYLGMIIFARLFLLNENEIWVSTICMVLGIYLLYRLDWIFGSAQSRGIAASIFLAMACFHGVLGLMVRRLLDVFGHLVFGSLGLVLALRMFYFQAENEHAHMAERIFLAFGVAFLWGIFQLEERKPHKVRVWTYAILLFIAMPALLGMELLGGLLGDTTLEFGEKIFLISVALALGLIGLIFGRGLQQMIAQYTPTQKASLQWHWRRDGSELIWLAPLLFGLGSCFFLIWQEWQRHGESSDDLVVISSLALSYGLSFLLGVFLERRKTLPFAINAYKKLRNTELGVSNLGRIGEVMSFISPGVHKAIVPLQSFSHNSLAREDRWMNQNFWTGARGYLSSISFLVRLMHQGLMQAYWFWGFLLWILAGVLFGIR